MDCACWILKGFINLSEPAISWRKEHCPFLWNLSGKPLNRGTVRSRKSLCSSPSIPACSFSPFIKVKSASTEHQRAVSWRCNKHLRRAWRERTILVPCVWDHRVWIWLYENDQRYCWSSSLSIGGGLVLGCQRVFTGSEIKALRMVLGPQALLAF